MRDTRRVSRRASLSLALLVVVLCSVALSACGSGPASGQPGVLTFALSEDPDPLDPTTSSTFVSRIVYVDMCEKLYDVGPKLQIVPQLASALPQLSKDKKTMTIPLRRGVRFNDDTPFNAQAVKTTLDHFITYKESSRTGDLASVASVEVADPYTVKLHLKAPSAPLLSLIADRAGMILSPTQLKKLGGAKFATNPVCVGAFKYTDRVAGDHITLDKSPFYYDRDKVHLKRIIFKIITDGPVRASNLRSGDVDVAERLEPFDVVSIKGDSSIKLQETTSIGYQGITINTGNTRSIEKGFQPGKVKTPLGQHPELREAFEAALDRDVINKVVFYNQVTPDCGPISPVSPWFDKSLKCPGRNLAKARQLVAKSGVKTPIPVKLMLEASSQTERLGQVIQAMAKEAGFAVNIQPSEFTTALDRGDQGDFDAFQIGWSGRVDPDGNLYSQQQSEGATNYGGEANPSVDKGLEEARTTTETDKRRAIYKRVISTLARDRNIIYLYHDKLFTGSRGDVSGVEVRPDGLPRVALANVGGKGGV
jgi:peptide/nickel transport system substrate-binding protein